MHCNPDGDVRLNRQESAEAIVADFIREGPNIK